MTKEDFEDTTAPLNVNDYPTVKYWYMDQC
jgi:hypothetical protein